MQTWCTSSSWKIFFSPTRASWWLLDSFWHPEPKNKWFLLCRHDVRRVHEKFPSRRLERADGCYTHFGILSPKTSDSYFVEMMYVEFMKNFLLADSTELDGCWTHFGFLSPKTSDSYFVDMMYVEFMKKFSFADSSELMAVRLILPSWDQKQVIPPL